jgi:hypothetical protein
MQLGDNTDEIMLEVKKLQALIAECCPEVMNHRFKLAPDIIELKDEVDILNRHRLNILAEAIGTKKTL